MTSLATYHCSQLLFSEPAIEAVWGRGLPLYVRGSILTIVTIAKGSRVAGSGWETSGFPGWRGRGIRQRVWASRSWLSVRFHARGRHRGNPLVRLGPWTSCRNSRVTPLEEGGRASSFFSSSSAPAQFAAWRRGLLQWGRIFCAGCPLGNTPAVQEPDSRITIRRGENLGD